jgi:hypothetical protein
MLESKKYLSQARNDGGYDPERIEYGTNLTLWRNAYGLVGYWTFDEGIGTTAYDYSGYNNHGTLINGPTWQSGSNCKVGGCLQFDGNDDYVNAGNGDNLNARTNDFSITLWEKVQLSTSGYDPFIFKNSGYGGNQNNWSIRQCNLTGLLEVIFGTQTNSYGVCGNSVIANSTWKHIGVVLKRGSGIYIYVNGVLDKIYSSPLSGDQTGNGLLQIGGKIGGTYGVLNGYLDEIRIYNRALSDAEIKAIYNATK